MTTHLFKYRKQGLISDVNIVTVSNFKFLISIIKALKYF